jgi:hypothetical protein
MDRSAIVQGLLQRIEHEAGVRRARGPPAHDPAGISATSPGGLRSRNDRAVGFATPTSYAARAGAQAVNALTFQPDQSVGADQCSISVESAWVSREASLASKLKRLIPVLIEDCELKLAHHTSDYVDLIGWDGSPRSPTLDPLLNAVGRLVGRPPQADWAKLSEYEEDWRMFGSPTLAAFALGKPIKPPAPGVQSNLMAIAAEEWPDVRDRRDINRLRRFELHFRGTYYADEARILRDALEANAEKEQAFQEKQGKQNRFAIQKSDRLVNEEKSKSDKRQSVGTKSEHSGHKSNGTPNLGEFQSGVSVPPLKEVHVFDRQIDKIPSPVPNTEENARADENTHAQVGELQISLAPMSSEQSPSQQPTQVDVDTSHGKSRELRRFGLIFSTIGVMLLMAVLSSNWWTGPAQLLSYGNDTIGFGGVAGGPFNPDVITLRLSAEGGEIHWTSENNSPAWLRVSPTAGTIPAGRSVPVQLKLSDGATVRSAQPNPYKATITFHGDIGGSIQKTVQLSVHQ